MEKDRIEFVTNIGYFTKAYGLIAELKGGKGYKVKIQELFLNIPDAQKHVTTIRPVLR